jgi:hypothetical protein
MQTGCDKQKGSSREKPGGKKVTGPLSMCSQVKGAGFTSQSGERGKGGVWAAQGQSEPCIFFSKLIPCVSS